MTTKWVLITLGGLAALGCTCLGGALMLGALAGRGSSSGGSSSSGGGGDPALLGSWLEGGVSGSALYDAVTGDFEGFSGGDGRLLELRGDGTGNQAAVIESRLGVCVTRIFTSAELRWSAEAGSLALDFTGGDGHAYNSCANPKVTTLTPRLEPRRYRYRLETEDGALYLVLDDGDGRPSRLRRQP